MNNSICPCVFINKSKFGLTIIAVYVDDLNLIGTPEELTKAANYLKKEFDMKDLGKKRHCLGLQVEYYSNGILVHQSIYIYKEIIKMILYGQITSTQFPEVNKDPFCLKEENEELFGPEVPYLSAIGALMYLANCTRPNIAFSINLLARYSSAPTKRHWNGVKHILRYLRGTSDMGLYYSKESKSQLGM